LITGVVGGGPLTDWEALRKEAASTTPERLLDRIDGTKQISAPKRTLFTSLYPKPNPTDEEREETARLAAKREEYETRHKAIEKRFPEHIAEFEVSVNTGMRLSEQYSLM
jgi:hypothetical protein